MLANYRVAAQLVASRVVFNSTELVSIWPDAISRWIGQGDVVKLCAYLRESATGTLAVIVQTFGEESMSCARVFEWNSSNSSRSKMLDR
jgi:hypothetical protein